MRLSNEELDSLFLDKVEPLYKLDTIPIPPEIAQDVTDVMDSIISALHEIQVARGEDLEEGTCRVTSL